MRIYNTQQNLGFGNIFKVPDTPKNRKKAKNDSKPIGGGKKFFCIYQPQNALFYEPFGNAEELRDDFDKAPEITEYSCPPSADRKTFLYYCREAIKGNFNVLRFKEIYLSEISQLQS